MIVYRYGALAPTFNEPIVREQMRLAFEFRKTLTAIECRRRCAIVDLIEAVPAVRSAHDELRIAMAEKEAAWEVVRLARSKTHTRSESKEEAKRLSVARKRAKALIVVSRSARRSAMVELVDRVDKINADHTRQKKGAHGQSTCGVYWGSYLLVEAAEQAAAKAPLYDKKERPSFPECNQRDAGAVSVQVQGGMSVANVIDKTNRLVRIEMDGEHPRPCRAPDWTPENNHRVPRRGPVLWLRVGSEGRDPVWAKLPIVLHRPLPDAARIKVVTVRCANRGLHEEWSVNFCLDTDAVPHVGHGEGIVAINLGWRQFEDGVRVATAVDEHGAVDELRLDNGTLQGIALPDEIRRRMDNEFNAARSALASWLVGREVPAWLTTATRNMPWWRASEKLYRLAQVWRDRRFDGDQDGYEPLEKWRYHHHHLWTWQTDQRLGALRHRKDVYRVWAAGIASKYETVILGKINLPVFASHNEDEDEDEDENDNKTARANRHKVAVSELRAVVKDAVEQRGGRYEQLSSVNATQACADCGDWLPEGFDAEKNLTHVCVRHGHSWDQDENNARNLLARWSEQPRDTEITGPARNNGNGNGSADKPESKWAKAKRKKAEKEDRQRAARNIAEKSSDNGILHE